MTILGHRLVLPDVPREWKYQLVDDYLVRADSRGAPFVVFVGLAKEEDWASLTVESVCLEAESPSTALTPRDVARLELGRIFNGAIAYWHNELEKLEYPEERVDPVHALQRHLAKSGRRGQAYSGSFLEKFGRAYRSLAADHESPAKELARLTKTNIGTVYYWASKAREDHVLDPPVRHYPKKGGR